MLDAVRLSAEVARLPLPLAQTLRRALNAKSPQEAHTASYYFFECALKLSASAQIGVYVSLGCTEPGLNELIENITRASTGHWLAILREVSSFLSKRADKSLVPLADVSERLTRKEPRPAARAFLDFVAQLTEKPDGRKSLNVLDLFDAIVNYRNQELGHGAMRTRDFYAEAAPLLVDATLEAINAARPLGELQLSVARDVVDHKTSRAQRLYQRLAGDGIQAPVTGVQATSEDQTILAGRVVLTGGVTRVILHPLVVYEVDELERDRVGFVNLVNAKRVAAGTRAIERAKDGTVRRVTTQITVKRVEYLDYDSGARLSGQDATEELADLLTRLRGTRVSADSVDKLAGEPEPGTSSSPKALLPRGDGTGEFIGDFEIIEELGRGGMGVVYKARQGSLGRLVALKVLPPALAGDPVAVTRFKREVAALGRCDHANVVKVLHAGQDGDRYFYAMEYVEGCDLAGVFGIMSQWKGVSGGKFREGHLLAALSSSMQLRKEPKTTPKTQQEQDPDYEPLPEAPKAAPVMPEFREGQYYYTLIAKILADAARGVEHLHDHGIIHRDIKPANIMLTGDGKRAIVMDLGLAAVAGQKGLSVANSAARIVGTLRYMPPEQLQRHLLDVTNKADIYSMGATLYELACLAPIFDGDTEARLIQQVLQEQPIAPKKANPAIPDDLATIISVATAKIPGERYGSAEALAEDLEAFSRGDPISMRPPGALHYLKLFYRKNKGMVLTAAAAVALLIALSTWFVVNLGVEKAAAETARDQAEVARADALKQQSIAEQQANIARDERQKAEAAELVAKDERDKAEREKTHAQAMETKASTEADRAEREAEKARQQEAEAKRLAKKAEDEAERAKIAEKQARERFAESLVLQADALVKANRHETARGTYELALKQARELGMDTFPAESGLALLRQDTPSETTLIPTQPFPSLEFACFSADGKRVLLRSGSSLTLWDVATWKASLVVPMGAQRRGVLAISPDGTVAACAANTEIAMISLADGRELSRFSPSEDVPSDMEFSPDGKSLAVVDWAGGMFEFNWADGKLLRRYEGTQNTLRGICYSPDGLSLATCGEACTVWVFNRSDGTVKFSFSGHQQRIFSCRFSPDGSQLCTAGWDTHAILWDLSSQKELARFETAGSSVMWTAFSQDAKNLVLGDFGGAIEVYEIASKKALFTAQAHFSGTLAVAFVGETLEPISVGANDGPRQFTPDGKLKRFVAGHHNPVNSMHLSNDGRKAVAISYGECVIVWDTVTGAEIRRFGTSYYSFVRMDVSADFRFAMCWGNDGRVTFWVIATGALALELPDRKQPITWAALASDASIAALGLTDGRVEIWDLYNVKVLHTIPSRDAIPDRIDLSTDGARLAVGYRNLGVAIFDLGKGKPVERALIWCRFAGVAFAGGDSGRLLTTDTERTANLWDIEKREVIHRFVGHEGLIWSISSSAENNLCVTYSHDGTMRVWDMLFGTCTLVCPGPDAGVKACAISADGSTVALSGLDASLRIWSTKEPVERRRFSGHLGIPSVMVALPDGRFAVTASSSGELKLWDLNTGQCMRSISAHGEYISGLLVPPGQSRICITASYDNTARVWDLTTGRCLHTFSGHTGPIYTLALMPDGVTVISGGVDTRVLLWNWQTLQITRVLDAEDKVMCAAYWPNYDLIIAGRLDRKIKLFSLKTGNTGFDDGLYSNVVTDIAFSADRTKFIVAGWGLGANVFSADERLLLEIGGHTDSITHAEFSPDGRYIITASDDGTLRFWNASDGKELRSIPHRAFRQGMFALTPEGKRLLFCGGESVWHMWQLNRSSLHESLPGEVRAARATLQNDPVHAPSLKTLCRWYAFRGDLPTAHELLLAAEQAGEKFEQDFVLELCWQTEDLERVALVLGELKAAGAKDGLTLSFLSHGLAESYLRRGDKSYWASRYEPALADYERAASIDASYVDAMIGKGNALAARQEWTKAATEFSRALNLDSKNKTALLGRANALAALADWKQALADYQVLAELEPGLAYRWNRCGEVRAQLKDFEGAERDFAKALSLYKDYPDAFYGRGFSRYLQGRFEDSIADFTRYIDLEPNLPAGYAMRGDCYRAQQKWQDAISDYDGAIALASDVYTYYECRADARARQGEFVGSVSDFRKALELGAPAASAQFNLGCAYALWAASLPADSGRWAVDKSLDALEEAVKSGFDDWKLLKEDKDLNILRAEPRYLKLVEGK